MTQDGVTPYMSAAQLEWFSGKLIYWVRCHQINIMEILRKIGFFQFGSQQRCNLFPVNVLIVFRVIHFCVDEPNMLICPRTIYEKNTRRYVLRVLILLIPNPSTVETVHNSW
jgi:hypothetical protein